MIKSYITTATVTNKRTLVLDEIFPRIPKRVRVTLEALPTTKTNSSFLVKLKEIHKTLLHSEYQSRRKDEIDAELRAERNSWGD